MGGRGARLSPVLPALGETGERGAEGGRRGPKGAARRAEASGRAPFLWPCPRAAGAGAPAALTARDPRKPLRRPPSAADLAGGAPSRPGPAQHRRRGPLLQARLRVAPALGSAAASARPAGPSPWCCPPRPAPCRAPRGSAGPSSGHAPLLSSRPEPHSGKPRVLPPRPGGLVTGRGRRLGRRPRRACPPPGCPQALPAAPKLPPAACPFPRSTPRRCPLRSAPTRENRVPWGPFFSAPGCEAGVFCVRRLPSPHGVI